MTLPEIENLKVLKFTIKDKIITDIEEIKDMHYKHGYGSILITRWFNEKHKTDISRQYFHKVCQSLDDNIFRR